MKRITFMRHGDIAIDYASSSINMLEDTFKLSDKGILQATEIAKKLKTSNHNVIIISDSIRTRETALILSQTIHIPFIVEPLLNPWKARTDPSIKFLSVNDYWNSYAEFISCNGVPKCSDVPWESFESLKARTLEGIRRYEKFKNVLIISHSIIISCFTGITQKGIPYCSPQTINYSNLQCLPPDFKSILNK